MRPLLRSLRIRNFAGELLDAPQTIAAAAVDAGLDPATLNTWVNGEDVVAALREDMALARSPKPAALVLNHKLAGWEGGRRYTCPSYEITRKADGLQTRRAGLPAVPHLRGAAREPAARRRRAVRRRPASKRS